MSLNVGQASRLPRQQSRRHIWIHSRAGALAGQAGRAALHCRLHSPDRRMEHVPTSEHLLSPRGQEGKKSVTEILHFRFSRPQNGNSDLISYCAVSDSYPTLFLGVGVRLNTYSDSIGPVWSPMPQALNPTGPSSAAIQRRGTVQKHRQSTQRLSIQIEGGCRLTGRCRRACDSSFLWTCHWAGCSQSIRSEVMSAANACTVVAGHLLPPF